MSVDIIATNRNLLKLILSIAIGILLAIAVYSVNPELGTFAILMLLIFAASSISGVYFSVQSIKNKEKFRFISWFYLLLLIVGVFWAYIDM